MIASIWLSRVNRRGGVTYTGDVFSVYECVDTLDASMLGSGGL